MIPFLQAIPLLGGLFKTVFGDKSESNSQTHNEQMAVYGQFGKEFGHSKTKWDSFIDGLNRLPRPLMTYGIIALFVWCARDPLAFVVYAEALQAMPQQGWVILGIIITFWFGGKLPKDFALGKIRVNIPKIAKNVSTRFKQPETAHETMDWKEKQEKRYTNFND